MDLANLKILRGQVKGTLTRALNYANNIDKATVTVQQLKNKREIVTGHFKRFEGLQDSIEELVTDATEFNLQITERDEIEQKYIEIVSLLDVIIDEKSGSQTSASQPSSSSTQPAAVHIPTVNVRLPAIELPSFEGSYADWTSFADLFEATIASRPGLSDAQKLQYLKTSVKKEAADLIKSLPITNDNYKTAWDILKGRYHNEREIAFSLLKKLFCQPHLTKESSSALQKMLDVTKECLRSLKNMGRPTDKWDDLIIYMIVDRLDSDSRRQWALRLTGTSIPTLKQLEEFFEQHVRGLEASSSSSSSSQKAAEQRKPSTSHQGAAAFKCTICKNDHPIYKCTKFINASHEERSDLVRKHKLCYNCLRTDHQSRNCTSKSTCKHCKKAHNTLLHNERSNATASVQAQSQQHQPQATSNSTLPSSENYFTSGEMENTQVLLSTVIAKVRDSSGNIQHVRILLDSGSQATMITERCANALGLKKHHSNVTVTGISSSSVGQALGEVRTKLSSTTCDASINISALVYASVTGILPKYTCARQRWTHLEGLQLADPNYHEPGPIDILLGADYTAAIMRDGRRRGDKFSPIAQNTLFGWVLCGRVNIDCGHQVISNHAHCELENIVKRFWELEQIPETKHLTPEEQLCEEHFRDTVQRDESGRFVVQLPLNTKIRDLGSSRNLAIQRLKQVEKRLMKKPEYKADYVKFMREYESLGHMEQVPVDEIQEVKGKTNYLPHHFVLKAESTTTKFRVVFDASAKTDTGTSLNDCLLLGAVVQNEIFAILLKSRLYKYIVKADIVKMFRQYHVFPPHQDLQRIVWRESPDQPIRDYRLKTNTYGEKSALFIATRCNQELARQNAVQYPLASAALENDTYVDDAITGGYTIEEVKQLVSELNTVGASAGLTFSKWCSNDNAVLTDIPSELREQETLFDFDKGANIKALGIKWNTNTDCFLFSVSIEPTNNVTMRVMLSELAKVFDPLGLITPITIVAKMLFQELWLVKGITWESTVPTHVIEKWNNYRSQLKAVENITIPRCVLPTRGGVTELHGFSDASERAYGAVVYIRYQTPDGLFHSNMVTSKSRVAPVTRLSIERLELCACAELVKLLDNVAKSFNLNCDVYAWTDSTICLRYIAAHPSRWKTFVAHKVAKIQARFPKEIWRHVRGTDNPADLISRGVTAANLENSSLWWQGPAWLCEKELPISQETPPTTAVLEERKNSVFSAQVSNDSLLISKYSSLNKLIRLTAYVFRLKNMILKKPVMKGALCCSELKTALMHWVKVTQHDFFRKDIQSLQQNQKVYKKSTIKSLNPFIDRNGFIRVGGRLKNSNLPEPGKHQLIIPHDSELCKLLINDAHISNLHADYQLLWTYLQHVYWIPKAKSTVKGIIRKCVVCRRQRAETVQQLMGSLPKARVTPSPPFENTGIDYAGPFQLRVMKGRSNKTFKGYFAIFVCMCTKAVHLEAVSDMTSETFIAALKRFVSRRGVCVNIFSDCGSNFVGADKELQKLLLSSQHNNKVADVMSTRGINWSFNTPAAPHQGGIWEAGVKSVKYHLRRVVGNTTLTFEEFSTILCQIEACLNSRPLCAASNDPSDLAALTPGHFLIGRPLTTLPEPSLLDIRVNRLGRWQLCQQMTQHFWNRWSTEYLSTLQQRFKWTEKRDNLSVGDLVLLNDEMLPPSRWKLGRICETLVSSDGCVRNVNVKTLSGMFTRSISKLTPILFNDERD